MVRPQDYNHFPHRLTPPAASYPGIPGPPAEEGRIPYYADTGCAFSATCLSCHLPKCVHDMTASEMAQLRNISQNKPLPQSKLEHSTTARAVRDLCALGMTREEAVEKVAQGQGVSRRTIYRRLAPPDHPHKPRSSGRREATAREFQGLMALGMQRPNAIRRLAATEGVSTQAVNKRIREALQYPSQEK